MSVRTAYVPSDPNDLTKGTLIVNWWVPDCGCCMDRPQVHAENQRQMWDGLLAFAVQSADLAETGEQR